MHESDFLSNGKFSKSDVGAGKTAYGLFSALALPYSDASGRCIKLTKDAQHLIYAYDNKGKVYIYDKRKDTFVLKCNLQKILGGSIVLNELLVDEKGNFWLAMDRGIYCLSAATDGKEIVRETAKGRFVLKNTYINHIQFIGQKLLIGTFKDVYCYSMSARKLEKKISGSSVVSSYHDIVGHRIWLGIWWTAVYSGHHYIIDVMLGILTTIVGVLLMESKRLWARLKKNS
jgi:ligand-binding sensor domain-containing protein